jgi:hypothetical protein
LLSPWGGVWPEKVPSLAFGSVGLEAKPLLPGGRAVLIGCKTTCKWQFPYGTLFFHKGKIREIDPGDQIRQVY